MNEYKIPDSNFMSLSKNDFIKSVGPAIFGAILKLVSPIYNVTVSALLAGKFPIFPSLEESTSFLLQCLGISISSATGYLIHKFFSNEYGMPFNGALNKYIASEKINNVSGVNPHSPDSATKIQAGMDRFASRLPEEKK